MPAEQLLQLWAAMAPVPIKGASGLAAAQEHLYDLEDRCLVQRDEHGCYMHDILRGLAVSEAKVRGRRRCYYDVDRVRSPLSATPVSDLIMRWCAAATRTSANYAPLPCALLFEIQFAGWCHGVVESC